MRAWVLPAPAHLASHARRPTLGCENGCLEGTELGWLAQPGIRLVVPATATLAGTVEAHAHAAAGEGMSLGRRGPTVRHGQGKTAWTERLDTEVVGITGLTPSAQAGSAAPGRHHHRRDFEPHPSKAVVVQKWQGRDDGPGGQTVCLPTAAVEQPLKPVDADDARSRMAHCGLKEAKPLWDLGHPPQKTGRAVRGHGVFTLLMFALAPAYRLPGEQAARGEEPVGWPRGRRQRLQQSRDQVMVFAQQVYGIFQVAAYSLLPFHPHRPQCPISSSRVRANIHVASRRR